MSLSHIYVYCTYHSKYLHSHPEYLDRKARAVNRLYREKRIYVTLCRIHGGSDEGLLLMTASSWEEIMPNVMDIFIK